MKIRFFLLIIIAFCGVSTVFAQADSLKSVVYGKEKTWTAGEQTLTMDIYFPKRETGKNYPLVMMMHGGSFLTGSKEAMKSHCKILADSGFIAVTINYRKGWERGSRLGCDANLLQLQEAVYRATQDANAALNFLIEKQEDYAIDTNWIFTGGSSAGGVLALNLAYLKQDAADRLFPQASKTLGSLNEKSKGKQNFNIKGICNMWGALPDSTLVTKTNAVPTIFYHGTDDIIVPFDIGLFGTMCSKYPPMYGSACIYRQTVAAGKSAVLNVSEGGNHGPKEFYAKITMSNTACFFKKVMNSSSLEIKTFNTAKAGCR